MTQAELKETFIGRQPILDRDLHLFGYEFLFRGSDLDVADVACAQAATSDVVCKLFAELGLASILETRHAFINVNEDFLDGDTVDLVKGQMVVLEIDIRQRASERFVDRCNALRNRGFALCLCGITDVGAVPPALLACATYLKIDSTAMDGPGLKRLATDLRSCPAALIAEKVETDDTYRLCREAGFRYFQGYFFARPLLVEGKRLSPSTQAIFQLIKLLQSDAETAELEGAFKRQPELAINLLRLTNSVANGLSVRVTSIRQAINLLGRLQLMRWLQLLVFAGGKGSASLARNPLMQLAALRARFMEMLAERCFPKRRELRDSAFLAGLMSLMPAALGISMTDILAGIAASPELRRALSRHEGELGQLLLLTQRYDDNDRDGTLEILVQMGGTMDFIALGECLAEVIAWVQSLEDSM